MLNRKTQILGFGLSFAVILFMIWNGWSQIPDVNWNIDFRLVALAFLLHSLLLLAATFGWHLIFKQMAGSDELARDMRVYVISNAAKRLPGGLWGAASRVYLSKRGGVPEG